MTVDVYGSRVRQARVLRRMTSKAVMAELGWKGARQTRLEQATTSTLGNDEFVRLAEVLRFPAKFFTTAPGSRVDATDLLFRAPRATTAAEKEYLAQFAAALGDFLDSLDSRWPLPPVKLPIFEAGTPVATVASSVRERMGIASDAPIPYLTYETERCGVPVITRLRRSRSTGALSWDAVDDDTGLSEKHLGYSTRVGEYGDRPLVVVRASGSWERTRWTVAHEIGHLVLHAGGGEVTEDQELEASRFASELLAPAALIATEVPKMPSLMNLVPLKLKWGISIGALIRHLSASDLIDEQRYEMLRRQLYTRVNPDTGHTWGKTEPGWDAREAERPRLLSRWVERCYGANSAAMLASHKLMWPQDVLEDFLAGQRPAPVRSAAPVIAAAPTHEGGTVIAFDQFRQRRRA
ncbi:Zn-dependent peptidase ImmA (M78 family)/transcriptional regulator with XRE-family HTH domain [Nocardia kruczakiae]|uniref:Zn-dependent peptidase ImmA (M78 family)/transcriptional regulator with XRE-family HTH domain n=1 Tax=Nocardia kruczakiae TaxID=261477 RepID=A0ABU1XEH0_9NOCA|nr:ImmA/IrrE family metallo-endopeptidase [Nocardia kruczakiae]MDR7168945.1 Zn-dependent peptidase ImmA (M78 family)/transcriptional regulator with XRE-family HTH domain [Nocardia kruczakiae]